MPASLVRWRTSGSKPPSSRQVRRVISSQPRPAWPVVQVSSASSAIGTESAWRRTAGWRAGRTSRTRSRMQLVPLHPLGEQARLVLPLVAQHEVDVAERERGQRLLGLELEQLAAQARARRAQRSHGGQGEPQRNRLESRDAGAARHRPGGGREVGLRHGRALQQRVGVIGQHQRRVREAHAAAGSLEQPHAGLALENGELLRDGRRRELQGVGHRGDRAALPQLAQQAEAPELEHR